MIGRLIESLFVQVRVDMKDLSRDLQQGVAQTRQATSTMAMSWGQVGSRVEEFTRSLNQGKITQGQYTSEMNRLASAMKVVAGSYREAQREVWGYAKAGLAAQQSSVVAFNPRPIQAFTRSAGQARMQMMNLGFQLNDIGQTLATGMNPMTVMIQQGSQIAQIYGGQGGVNQLFRDLGSLTLGLVRKMGPLIAVVAVIASGMGILTREINKTADANVSFRDTMKAVFQVVGGYIWDLIKGPVAALKDGFNVVIDFIATWFPKVMNAVIGGVVASVRTIGATWDLLPDLWHDTWTAIKNTSLEATQAIINFVTQDMLQGLVKGLDKVLQVFTFSYEAVKIVWSQLPELMKDAVGGAVNFIVSGLESMVNGAIEGINRLITELQGLVDFVGADQALEFFGFSGNLPTISKQDLSKWRMETGNALNDTTARLGAAAAETFNTAILEGVVKVDPTDLSRSMGAYRNAFERLGSQVDAILKETGNTDFVGGFFEEVRTQAIKNALARIAEGTEAVGSASENTAEKVKKASKQAAEEVKRVVGEITTVMSELDQQLTQASENLAGVFGNAFERLAETGKLTFRSILKDLNSLIIRSTSQLLQEGIAGGIKGIITSKGGLGGIFGGLFGSLFGASTAVAAPTARARGGVQMPWRNFIAGEEGAELVRQDGPSSARRVSTAGRTRHMLAGSGGASPQVNIYVTTPDVASFQKSQSQIASRMGMFMARGRRNQ